MTELGEWQGRVGQSWAAEWRRTDRSFRELTDRLLERIAGRAFSRVLDIGCGAGELSLEVARSWPLARVTGIDVSPALLAVARERSLGPGNLDFELGDAATWSATPGAPPDLLMSRHGVMFFADPVAAFAHLRQLAAPGAVLLFSCFRAMTENPFFAEIARLLPQSAPPPADAPGPFAFADRKRVEAILDSAGWRKIAFERADFRMIAGGGADPVADALGYFTRIGPAARALAAMPDGARDAARAQIADLARAHLQGGTVGMGASAWIVTAVRE